VEVVWKSEGGCVRFFFFGVYDFLLNFIATGVDVDIFCFGYLSPFFFMGIAIVFLFFFLGSAQSLIHLQQQLLLCSSEKIRASVGVQGIAWLGLGGILI
jgi:apolipoprotein N-acyltransferase